MSQADIDEQNARKAIHATASGAVSQTDLTGVETALKGTATGAGDTLGELETRIETVEAGSALAGDVTGTSGANKVVAINGRSLAAVTAIVPFDETFDVPGTTPDGNVWELDAGLIGNGVGISSVVSGGKCRMTASLSGGRATYWRSKSVFNPTGKEFIFDVVISDPSNTSKNLSLNMGIMASSADLAGGAQYGPQSGRAFFLNKYNTAGWSIWKEGSFPAGTLSGMAAGDTTSRVRLRHDSAASRMKVDEWIAGAWVNRSSWDYGSDSWTLPTSAVMFFGIFHNAPSDGYVDINEISTNAVSDPVLDGAVPIWNKTTGAFEFRQLVAADVH